MEHYYKNKLKFVSGILTILPGSLIIAAIFGLITWMLLEEKLGLEFKGAALYGGIAVAVLILLLFVRMAVRAVDYLVTDKGIFFVRGKKVLQSFIYEQNSITSQVTSMSYGGVPSGKIRAIKVFDGIKTKDLAVGLRKKDFDDFMARVLYYQEQLRFGLAQAATQAPGIDTAQAYSPVPANTAAPAFVFNKQEYILNKQGMVGRTILRKSTFFIIMAAFLLFITILINREGTAAILKEAAFATGGIFIVLVIAYIAAVVLPAVRVKEQTPSIILLEQNVVQIDKLVIPKEQIVLCQITPATYYAGDKDRTINITELNGTKHKFYLGTKTLKASFVFSDYEHFADTISYYFSDTPGKFQYDL